MASCPAFDASGPYVSGLTSFIDCHVRALGEDGYRSLGSGSSFDITLTSLVTIYVALFGYRLMLGEVPSVRIGVLAFVKVGFVLALVQQWPAYQALAYNVAIDGPDRLATTILAPAGLGGDDRTGVAARIDYANALLGPEASVPVIAPSEDTTAPAVPVPSGLGQASPNPTIFNTATTERAAQILVLSALAGIVSVRIVAALLLALGPIFIAFLLFDATRGFFEGWVRGLIGAMLGAIAVSATLGFELTILEPQIALLIRDRTDNLPVALLAGQMLATTIVFALVLLLVMGAATRVAFAFRLGQIAPQWLAIGGPAQSSLVPERTVVSPPPTVTTSLEDRSRALVIANAAQSAARRDYDAGGASVSSGVEGRRIAVGGATPDTVLAPVPLGQSGRRRTSLPSTPSAGRREATA